MPTPYLFFSFLYFFSVLNNVEIWHVIKSFYYKIFRHVYFYKCCQLEVAGYLVPLLLVLEYIMGFNPSRFDVIICIMISNIKIFSWFKLHTFLNIETATTINWWSSVSMVVLVVVQFSWFKSNFSCWSPCFRHSYNVKTKFQITKECFKVFKICIKWTNVGMKQTKTIILI